MDLKNNLQLKAALDDYLFETTADLTPEKILSEGMAFSPRFSRRMNRLIRKAKRQDAGRTAADPNDTKAFHPANQWRKRVVLCAVIMAVIAGTVSAVAAHDQIAGFILTIYEKYSVIVFHKDSDDHDTEAEPDTSAASDADVIAESSGSERSDARTAFLPTYIPEGYIQADKIEADLFLRVIYADKAGDEILYERSGYDNTTMTIDTEGIQAEEILIGQMNGVYYSNKGIQNLIWQDDSSVCTISGPAAREELIAMAESIY